MLQKGPAKKLTIYLDETHQWHGEALYEALVGLFQRKGVSGVTVIRGFAGFGESHVYHTTKILRLSENLPVKIEVVESEEVIRRILPTVYEMVEKGVVEMSDTEVIKASTPPQPASSQGERALKIKGRAKMLRIYIGEQDQSQGEPLYEAIVKKLRMMDIAGATVYRGVLGYGAHRRYHKGKFLRLSTDLPMMIFVVDTEENILKVIPVLDEMVQEGLVVLSDVEVIKYTHRAADLDATDAKIQAEKKDHSDNPTA